MDMDQRPTLSRSVPSRRFLYNASAVLCIAVIACSIYANLSYIVTNPADYRYFPPFEPDVNLNRNQLLGAEYFCIAQSLVVGEGFAHPFGERTGPTAWMSPVLPTILAGFLWVCDGSRMKVTMLVVTLQVVVLMGTCVLVLSLANATAKHVGVGTSAILCFGALLCDFRLCFQATHDCWLVLLTVDLLIAGLSCLRPLHRRWRSVGWGLFGGFCLLVNPAIGLTWVVMTIAVGLRQQAWLKIALAVLIATLTVLPWTVRNYLVFGRLIPVKSNLAYELYQSQCLQWDGLIENTTFALHPYRANSFERQEYKTLGETVYLDRKREQFWQAVRSDPDDYLSRVGDRFLGATLWYQPLTRSPVPKRPVTLWLGRLTYPMPFLAMLILIGTSIRQPLRLAEWTVVGVYVLYLFPYIAVSYYERYEVPLLGIKVLLVIWAVDRLQLIRERREPSYVVPFGGA